MRQSYPFSSFFPFSLLLFLHKQEDAALEMSTAKASYEEARDNYHPFLRNSEEFRRLQDEHEKRPKGPPLANPGQLFQWAKFKRRQVLSIHQLIRSFIHSIHLFIHCFTHSLSHTKNLLTQLQLPTHFIITSYEPFVCCRFV